MSDKIPLDTEQYLQQIVDNDEYNIDEANAPFLLSLCEKLIAEGNPMGHFYKGFIEAKFLQQYW